MDTDLTLDVPGATIVYDVRGSLPADDGRPPLLMVGQPMDASGFGTLASHFPTAPSSPTTPAAWDGARAPTG
jgi:hypothetical protein